VQKEYIWLGDTPLAVFEGANLFYVHPDNLDRPVMMTNNNIGQTIAWQARYDPFGNPVTVTSAITNNQRLPGQWFQIEDGLSYNWHRTYDPTIGRYTQADPLGFVDGPNKYEYAKSSPLLKVDPNGTFITRGPMTPIPPRQPGPNDPKQCSWGPTGPECHKLCLLQTEGVWPSDQRPDQYRKCMRECMAADGHSDY
jgi:RHS repeat-associated protein